MSLDKNKKIEELLKELAQNPENQKMTSGQLLDRLQGSGLFDESELSDFRKIEADGISANNAFKNSILSKVAYTTFDETIEFIHRQKENGITPTVDEIIKSGTLNNEMSAMDIASLAYYSKTFTPVNVMEEGQFSVKDLKNLKMFEKPPEMNMSYFRGVYRADSNIAMAMTVMSIGNDGKPELNVAFRGTDNASQNMMVEEDGTTVVKRNSLATYMTSVYPNMEQHGKAAFSPLFEAIKNGVENYNWDKKENLSVVATGHSLGGAMVEELTKENSRSPNSRHVVDKSIRDRKAEELMKENSAISFEDALKQVEDEYLKREAAAEPGKPNINLKSVVFGAPPNTREGWGNEFTEAVNRTKERYNELVNSNRDRSAFNIIGKITAGGSFIMSLFPEMSKVFKARKMETTFENKVLNERDHKILDRDFQAYNTPGDPIAKLLVKMNFAKEPSNMTKVQPRAQTDDLFSVATQPVVEQGDKDIVGPLMPEAPEKLLKRKPVENKGFINATKKMLATVSATFISAMTAIPPRDVLMLQEESSSFFRNTVKEKIKGLVGVGFNTTMSVMDFVSPEMREWKKNNLDINNHNMKAYSATMLMNGSPIRDWDNKDDMTPIEKVRKLIELKSKKDLLAMEVIMKECGVEEVVRAHKGIKDNPNPIAFEDLIFRANAWVINDEETDAGREMSAKFHALKEMFGCSIDLRAKETSTIELTRELSEIVEKEIISRGLPENIVSYTGFKTEKDLKAERKSFHAQINKLDNIFKEWGKDVERMTNSDIERIRANIHVNPEIVVNSITLPKKENRELLSVPPSQSNTLSGVDVQPFVIKYSIADGIELNKELISSKTTSNYKVDVKLKV